MTSRRQYTAAEEQIRAIARVHAAGIIARRPPIEDKERSYVPVHPVEMATSAGIVLDDWQRDILTTTRKHIAILVTRQGGKDEVMTWLALGSSLNSAGHKTLIAAGAEDQAALLLERIKRRYDALPTRVPMTRKRGDTVEFANDSSIIVVATNEATVRGIDAVHLAILNEASVMPDELQKAIMPMLAVTDGRVVAAGTARGKRGWFYNAIQRHTDLELADGTTRPWHVVIKTALDIPRISKQFLDEQRHELGDLWFRQEYMCEFLDDDTQFFASDLVEAAMDDDYAIDLDLIA